MTISKLSLCGFMLLAACAVNSGADTIRAASSAANACIRREALSASKKSVDIDTAAYAALSRCTAELRAEEMAFFSKYPGHKEYVRPELRHLNEVRLEEAKKTIALSRTQ